MEAQGWSVFQAEAGRGRPRWVGLQDGPGGMSLEAGHHREAGQELLRPEPSQGRLPRTRLCGSELRGEQS